MWGSSGGAAILARSSLNRFREAEMAQQQLFINSAALGEEYKIEDLLKAGKARSSHKIFSLVFLAF